MCLGEDSGMIVVEVVGGGGEDVTGIVGDAG